MISMILITLTLEPINCDEEDTCINAWIGVSFCVNPFFTRSCLNSAHSWFCISCLAQLRSTLVSYRMTKDHIIFNSTNWQCMQERQFCVATCTMWSSIQMGWLRLHMQKVVCYIVQENFAYILLEQCKTAGRNICQHLPFPQDPVLKDIMEIHLIGEHYFEVKEDGEPLIVSCHQIVN